MMQEQNPKTMYDIINMIARLHRAHDSFLESYPEDVNSPEGKRYCVNNVIRETGALLADLSHRLVVDKDMDPDTVEDTFMMILTNATELMDKYTGRSCEYYEEAIKAMILSEEGNDEE